MVLPASRHAQRGRGGLRRLHGNGLRRGLPGRAWHRRTRRLPDWLAIAFFGLYGLAVLVILGRHVLPGALDDRLLPLCPGQRPACHHRRGRRRTLRGGPRVRDRSCRWRDGSPTHPRRPHPRGRSGQADQPDPLDPDLEHCRTDLPGHGHHLSVRRRDHSAAVHPRRRRLRLRPDHVLHRCDDRLRRDARLPPVRGQRPGGLVDRQPVSALLRPEHDRLRLPRDRHQARQRADRRADRSGRLLHLAQPAAGGDQRRPDGPGTAQPGSTRARQDPDLARPRLHRADLHGGADDLPGASGESPCRRRSSSRPARRSLPTPRRPPGTSSVSRRCWSTSIPGWPASSCPA